MSQVATPGREGIKYFRITLSGKDTITTIISTHHLASVPCSCCLSHHAALLPTRRSIAGQKHCVTRQRTAARETTHHQAILIKKKTIPIPQSRIYSKLVDIFTLVYKYFKDILQKVQTIFWPHLLYNV